MLALIENDSESDVDVAVYALPVYRHTDHKQSLHVGTNSRNSESL